MDYFDNPCTKYNLLFFLFIYFYVIHIYVSFLTNIKSLRIDIKIHSVWLSCISFVYICTLMFFILIFSLVFHKKTTIMLLLFIITINSPWNYHYNLVRVNISMTLSHLPLTLTITITMYLILKLCREANE